MTLGLDVKSTTDDEFWARRAQVLREHERMRIAIDLEYRANVLRDSIPADATEAHKQACSVAEQALRSAARDVRVGRELDDLEQEVTP